MSSSVPLAVPEDAFGMRQEDACYPEVHSNQPAFLIDDAKEISITYILLQPEFLDFVSHKVTTQRAASTRWHMKQNVRVNIRRLLPMSECTFAFKRCMRH